LQALEEVKVREMAILDLQKKIVDGENKVKQQQNLYEAVRSDRNLYSKNLIEAQDEIEEMKRKFKIMNHQVEQLKEEIAAKDLALVKEHFDHMKVSRHPLARAAEYAKSPIVSVQASRDEPVLNPGKQADELSDVACMMEEGP
jgi:chromosome segregation ATPase